MKKKLMVLVTVLLSIAIAFVAAACSGKESPGGGEVDFSQVYTMAQEAGYEGTLEELIEAFKGDSAYKIAVSKGFTGSESDWLETLKGASGKDGSDGITPKVGDNGNWYIGDTDTGVKAEGEDGEKGEDGLSAYEIFMKYNPEYTGDEEQWSTDLVNGRLVRFKVTFKAEGRADIVKSVLYGYDLTDIPDVPQQAGNKGEWEITDYTDIQENITVNAIYKTIGITYKLINNDTEYEATGANLASETNLLSIPEEHNGKPVTSIGYQAFMNKTSLTHIIIPDSITQIAQRAFFGCSEVQSVTIPFVGESDKGITNTHLGFLFGTLNDTISDKLTKVTVTRADKIGIGAFERCDKLTSIVIGNDVKTIDDNAFRFCKQLTSFSIPEGVTTIGNRAFDNCIRLSEINIPNSVKTIGDYAFNAISASNIKIGRGVTTIGDGAFSGCNNLVSVDMGDSVKLIGESAFSACKALTSIKVSSAIQTVGDDAFALCDNLKYEIYGGNLRYLGNVLIGVTSTLITEATLKPTTTVIYSGAFKDCAALTNLTIPDSVTNIGSDAFAGCASLEFEIYGGNLLYLGDALIGVTDISVTEVTLKPTTTVIGNKALKDCEYLWGTVSIPNSVAYIGKQAFLKCVRINTLIIGSGVKFIDDEAFNNDIFNAVYYLGTAAEWESIIIQPSNIGLTSDVIYFYSETPVYDGVHWYYKNGVPTVWGNGN